MKLATTMNCRDVQSETMTIFMFHYHDREYSLLMTSRDESVRKVCQECKSFDKGKHDEKNGKWYCNLCWAKYDGKEDETTTERTGGRSGGRTTSRRANENLSPVLMNLNKLIMHTSRTNTKATQSAAQEFLSSGGSSQQRVPSLVGRSLKSFAPVTTSTFAGALSPRSSGTGRFQTSAAKKKFSLNLLMCTVDDIVSQIYVHFDEDFTKIILNALDDITSASNIDQKTRIKMRVIDELIQTLGEEHAELVQCIVDRPRDVLLRLLEEFCTLEDPKSKAPQSSNVPSFGTSVRFRRGNNKTGRFDEALSSDELWLTKMNKRYRQLVEESELDSILRRDFSMSGTSIPANTVIVKNEDHIRCHIPPPPMNMLPQDKRIEVRTALPEWTHAGFGTVTHLNTIQTAVFESIFHTSQNMLICAPTGAGKTMVALLAVLRQIQEQFDGGILDKDFKMIFVAPMKALAQEMVENFRKRLMPYHLIVRELTGDMQLTKKEIAETNLIVTTPEKWDVVTRKQSENELVKKTRLIIIDEIHLLNDERGPVIEAIVARTLRQEEMDPGNRVRLVGLSATLPNYKDVARFLHVDLDGGLKVFGPEFRPVPLEQTFIGTNDTSRTKEDRIDRLTYAEVVRNLAMGHQVMVFVHARKQTISLGKFFAEEAQRLHHEHYFQKKDMDREALKRGNMLQGRDLSQLFRDGICCHHAGLTRFDRTSVENLFREGNFKVLVCTSTLAWGVNLPAHTVIIRGTEVYDPKRGGYVPISVLDVMQIFGRAGRPQYDTSGHGIIVSDEKQISHYLRLIAHALPIESRFQAKLCDHLNAEVHAGTVSSIADALKWLEYTYMWQRIRVNPLSYGLTIADVRRDPDLRSIRRDFVNQSAVALADAGMIRYNSDTGIIDTTDLGRIASHYYIDHESIRTFNEKMRRPDETFIDTIDIGTAMNVVACANEFSQLRVRQEELDELQKIHALLPKQVQRHKIASESADETNVQWKVTTLLKAYISRVLVESHSLAADMLYVIQSAPRIARALFEIETQRGHPNTTLTFLTLCKCVERRSWDFCHPIVQFDYDFTESVLKHLNDKRPNMLTLQEMSETEIGSFVHNKRFGGIIKKLVDSFPTLRIDAEVQPITRTILRVKCTVTPTFVWDQKYHGGAEHFWLFVEDQDSNFIFHQEMVIVNKKHTTQETPLVINLTIPIVQEYDMYSIRVYSDRWLGSEEDFTFSVGHLHLPEDTQPTTRLLPMTPLQRDVIPEAFHPIYQGFTQLNAVQSQVFFALHHTDNNVFLGAPTGSGKTVAAEMAMLRVFLEQPGGKIVYIAPLKALVKERMKDWTQRFQKVLGRRVVELSGDVTPDIAALAKADIMCTTPEKWDGISRNWQVRSYVTAVRLVIFDEIHMLGTDRGPILEVIVSRMRYIGWHQKCPIRLVGLSTAVANPGDLGAWLGVDKPWCLFNFEPSVRPVPMRVHIAGYPGRHYCPRMATMNKPTYNAIVEKSPTKPVIVFVSSRRQTRLTAMALISFLMVEQNTARFVRMNVDELSHTTSLIQDAYLKHCIQFGIGIHHAGLAEGDKQIVEETFRSGQLQILVATSTLAWGVNFPAHLVIVKGTEFYDGKTKSYVDYPITDVLQMIGRAGRPQFDTEGVAQVLCHEPKKGFYRKFLYEPFPVESALHKQLHVHLNAEIVAGTVTTRQDAVDYLTWTFLFRRLVRNPSFYGLEDRSPKAVTIFLSGLVKKILYDLEQAGCLEPPDEEDSESDPNALRYSVLGKLCSYYYLSHLTAQHFDEGIQADSSHIELLTMLCEAQEFAELPVRHNEDKLNLELAKRVPHSIDVRRADSPHVKAFLLFQAHFQRASLPISDYVTDQKSAMDNAVRVIQSMVDIAANSGHLYSALRCMSFMQCIVQGRWWHDNTLLQLPHVVEEMLGPLAAIGVTHVAHVANASTATFESIRRVLCQPQFDLDKENVEETLYAARRLPLIDVHLSLQRTESDDDSIPFELTVDLTRLSVPTPYVVAPRFSKPKDEQYWIAIGFEATGELIALKRVNRLSKKATAKLRFDWDDDWLEAPQSCAILQQTLKHNAKKPNGTVDVSSAVALSVYVVCDSFLGLDQQYNFIVSKK